MPTLRLQTSSDLPLELQEAILLTAAVAASAAKKRSHGSRASALPSLSPGTSTRKDTDHDRDLAAIALALPFKTPDLCYVLHTTAHACSIDECCRRGDLTMLQWWYRILETPSANRSHSHTLSRHPRPIHDYTQKAMTLATSGNHIHVLDWWHSNAPSWIMKFEKRLLDGAARLGHVQALEWWFVHKFPSPYHPAWDFRARSLLQEAVDHGQWPVIEWWIEKGMALEPLAEVLPNAASVIESDLAILEQPASRIKHWLQSTGPSTS